ncbi:ClbS/DfsB family four-helix bundle protein [Microvirga rosea]|uniref:ClbS/DfsB family four-helix bundle protein n=1 Tax=Microvirga rosea TaxID=2715425 RepID=UPI001D0A71BC|nr:ClbS/DfsB family four-helix bundle protein [Microvirga rosea]MCB8822519.1 ClbS/DfsB family four-helix bundle protein [Microvirga rosea]
MAVPQNKDELLKAINSKFDKLIKDLNAVPAELTGEASMEGHVKGARMSVSNLVSYLIGWNELVLKWMERDALGKPIDYPDTGFKGNELSKLAQKFYRDYEELSYPQLLDRLSAAKLRIVSLIESHDNADLYGRQWYGRWAMGRMIQFNTSSPYDNTRGRLRTWLKAKGVSCNV